MGIFRYLLQGAGWEVGRTAAREGIDAIANAKDNEDEAPMTAAELARREKELVRREKELAKQLEKERKRKAGEVERQLSELKKRSGR
jgi:hypothetical protein